MLLRRLKVYKYMKKIPKPSSRLKYCPRCFVHLLMAQAGADLSLCQLLPVLYRLVLEFYSRESLKGKCGMCFSM